MARLSVNRLRELAEIVNGTICETGVRYSVTGGYSYYKVYNTTTRKTLVEGTLKECYMFLIAYKEGVYFALAKM